MILTPKQKAKELVDMFTGYTRVFHDSLGWENHIDSAKECSLMAVNEMIEVLDKMEWTFTDKKADYYREVKKEIEKL